MLESILTFFEIFTGILATALAFISMIIKTKTIARKFLISAWISIIISWICYAIVSFI